MAGEAQKVVVREAKRHRKVGSPHMACFQNQRAEANMTEPQFDRCFACDLSGHPKGDFPIHMENLRTKGINVAEQGAQAVLGDRVNPEKLRLAAMGDRIEELQELTMVVRRSNTILEKAVAGVAHITLVLQYLLLKHTLCQ